MQKIELSGLWEYRLDMSDTGGDEHFERAFTADGQFMVPGSACSNGIGNKQEYYKEFSKEAVRAPRERYEYIAPLWLSREVDFPEGIETKRVRLFLERVNIASELWLNEEKIGRRMIELSTPHVYDLTGKVTAGTHRLTLRIDNRNLISMGDMASGYSIDTQGYWNGIIGEASLHIEEIICIDNLQVYPEENGIKVKITTLSAQHTPLQTKRIKLKLSVVAPDGRRLPEKEFETELFTSRQNNYVFYEMEDISPWSEFHPDLYQLEVYGDEVEEKHVSFGMRILSKKEKKLFINGNELFLRGTIDCAQTPKTGYPPMDKETWLFRMRQLKRYGLNHMRFHAWCPPVAAFEAADECGIYLSVEMPLWLNRDVTPLELGDDPAHYDYYRKELISILDTYGNHPSFLLFSNGNENMGDFAFLEELTLTAKAYDTRHFYTMTSNFDHIVSPHDDYFCASDAYHECVRIQHIHDKVAESTCVDFERAVDLVPVPIVTFEVGQYCVYPDVDIIKDYDGSMLPVNFDVICKEMKKKGVYERRTEYVKASGAFAAKLYKEDIEAVLRTKGMVGFELLSLTDYTGQSTATVGILDVMYRDKKVIAPEEWRNFCCETVPLFMAKRIFSNQEKLCARLGLYQAGEHKIDRPLYRITITKLNSQGQEVFWETETFEEEIEVDLRAITKASMLSVVIRVSEPESGKEYENHWQVFCYPNECVQAEFEAAGIRVISSKAELCEAANSDSVCLATGDVFEEPMESGFIPVFWSPVHFPSQKPCGAIFKKNHPVFDEFPTEEYPDYQWKTLLDNAKAVDRNKIGEATVLAELVPNYVDNTQGVLLYEKLVGKAKVLFCGFDLNTGDLPAGQLKQSMIRYMTSEKFQPKGVPDNEV